MRNTFGVVIRCVVVAIASTAAWMALFSVSAAQPRGMGRLQLRVVDEKTNQPIAVRMHLTDPRGKPVKPPKLPYWHDHFVFSGETALNLRPGVYRFEMHRGPEYRVRHGSFQIRRGANDAEQVVMQRFADLKQEGWWSGELHIHRSAEDIPLLMLAEDLHVAPTITWWKGRKNWRHEVPKDLPPQPVLFDENRYFHLLAGEDERTGGALLYFQLPEPLALESADDEYPASASFLQSARQHKGVHVNAEKPFWWDFPVWLATGHVDSIGLANNHLWRTGVLGNEAWGRPRDVKTFPGVKGNGRWSEAIYYHVLNCGLRIPPSAGSASGVLPNPVGYNRVYVHCGPKLDYESWWKGLRAGRVVVTNGPLIRPQFNGQLPGHVFSAPTGEQIEIDIALRMSLREKVEYLEIVKDGLVEHQVRLDEYREKRGRLPTVTFDKSGWVLVRAVTENAETYRFASSGPCYVQIGEQPAISKMSAQFFLDWVNQRSAQIQLDDPQQQMSVQKYLTAAVTFWQRKVDSATRE